MNYLYYNENNTLRCGTRNIETKSFTSFNNSTIDLLSGRYMITIDISANVSESFYDEIDKSTDYFIDSPFSVFIKIGEESQSFTIGQYTPVNIHITRYINLQKNAKITISSNYSDFQNTNIHVTTERV